MESLEESPEDSPVGPGGPGGGPPQLAKGRIWLHIRDGTQRPKATTIAGALEDKGYTVPSIREVAVGPTRTQIRFFHPDGRAVAQDLKSLLEEQGITVTVEDFSNAGLQHHELWFSPESLLQ